MELGQSYTVFQMTPKDLEEFFERKLARQNTQAFISRFDNVLVGTQTVALIHSVNERTVLNYIKDGLVIPEEKISENDHHRFRLSYVLTLDFRE